MDMANVTSQLSLGIALSLTKGVGITGELRHQPGLYMGSEDPNSNPYSCEASALTIKLLSPSFRFT